MNNIRVLDCTLRDGGYCNNWEFGFNNEKKIVKSLIESGVDVVECGLLVNGNYIKGVSRFTRLKQVEEIIPEDCKNTLFTCLMNYGEVLAKDILPYDGIGVEGIRVAFHKKDMNEALECCRELKKKGYKVFVQAMVSLAYSDQEFLEMISKVNKIEPYAFYIVDSFGMMKRKDMTRLYYIVEHNLSENVVIGFHSHNNLQLAYSNAQVLADICSDRPLIIDTSIMGMGRGAGNLNTELFIEYLNEKFEFNYDVKPILRVIDDVISVFYNQNYWGYSLPNYLSATNSVHPNYALFLSEKNTLTVEDINNIFLRMEENKKISYDKNYIEKLYLEYMQEGKADKSSIGKLFKEIKGKKVILIAPGKSCETEHERIEQFFNTNETIAISVNFEYSHIKTDYIFVSNKKRFRELENKINKQLIVTSNIAEDINCIKVDYSELLCDVDIVKDNSVMMLIKLLIKAEVDEIFLVGVDGYSHETSENYAGEHLWLVAGNKTLDDMNEGMNSVLQQYSKKCKITFITKNKYINIQ